MLIATQLKRMFVFEENRQTIHLADPNPSWSVEQVKNFYSTHYPLLTNAKAGTPYVEGDSVVEAQRELYRRLREFSKAVQRPKDRSQIRQEQQQVAPKTLLPMVF